MISLRNRFLGAGIGIADQAVSSITNFALTVLVARSVDTARFGGFSLLFATYLLCLGIVRAVAYEPFVVRFTTLDSGSQARIARSGLGVALVAGVVFGGISAVAGLLIGGPLGSGLVVLGVVLPGLMQQDALRCFTFATGRASLSLMNDIMWAVVLVTLLIILPWRELEAKVAVLVGIWGLSASAAAVVAGFQARLRPAPMASLRWLRGQWDLVWRFAAEFLSGSAADQLIAFGVAAVSGLAAAGSLRAGMILFGPVNVLFMGVSLYFYSESVRLRHEGSTLLRNGAIAVSSGLGASALIWTAIASSLPERIGRAILGASWDEGRAVLLALGLAITGLYVATGPRLALRALGQAHLGLLMNAAVTTVLVASTVIATAFAGIRWGVACLAISAWLGAGIWWRSFLSRNRNGEAAGLLRDPFSESNHHKVVNK